MNKKVLVIFFALLLIATQTYAHGGVMSGHRDLKVYQTKYFRIIYPQECKNSAYILSQNADKIYEDVASDYGRSINAKMPVVFTGKVEQFNAYWSSTPYNHIVIYDTASIEDLAVFSEQMLSTFKHEVTHAFTFNFHASGWNVIKKIFGDGVNPAGLMITPGRAEGATLVSESNTGEGRLNDEFSKQMVRQAKIENVFPSYYTVQGAGGDYPYGNFYYFNGAFDEWLVKKYGMEKYSNWWFDLVNLKKITVGGAFKKNYRMSISLAWGMFFGDIYVPEDIIFEPVQEEIAVDFFNPNKKKRSNQAELETSVKNQSGSQYENLAPYSEGLFYTDMDCGAVYLAKADSNEKSGYKVRKLFTKRNLSDAKISKDGRIIALNSYSALGSTVKMITSLYDVKKKSFFYLNETGLTNPRVFKSGNDYYLFTREYSDHNYKLVSNKIIFEKDRIKGIQKHAEWILSSNALIQDGTQVNEGGQIVLLLLDGLETKFCLTDVNLSYVTSYQCPQVQDSKVSFRYVNADNQSKVYFTWINNKSQPSLGYLDLSNDYFYLENLNLNGGVYSPVYLGKTESVAFISKNYRYNGLYRKQIASEMLKNLLANKKQMEQNKVFEQKSIADNTEETESFKEFEEKSIKYNPFKFLNKGIFMPFCLATTYDYDSAVYKSLNSTMYVSGLTYITSDPWNAGLLQLSFGENIFGFFSQNETLFSISYTNGTNTSLFSYSFTLNTELRGFEWAKEELIASVNSSIPFGHFSTLTFGADTVTYYGRKNCTTFPVLKDEDGNVIKDENGFDEYDFTDLKTNSFFTQNTAQIQYALIKKSGPGMYEKLGFAVNAFAYNTFNYRFEVKEGITDNSFEAGARFRFWVPKLIPIVCKDNLCYNLPVRVSATLFPQSFSVKTNSEQYLYDRILQTSLYGLYNPFPLVNWSAELVLFGWNCQRALRGITAFYINDMRASLVLRGVLYSQDDTVENMHFMHFSKSFNQNLDYFNELLLRFELGLTPNISNLASSSNNLNLFIDFGLDFIDLIPVPGMANIGLKATF